MMFSRVLRLSLVFNMVCLALFSAGCVGVPEAADEQTHSVGHGWLARLDDGTVVLHEDTKDYICVSSPKEGQCDEAIEVNQGLDLDATKTVEALYSERGFDTTVVTAEYVFQDTAKKSRLDHALKILGTIADARFSTLFERFGKVLVEENTALKYPRDLCTTNTKAIGHKVKDPAGNNHCCPSSTYVAAMGPGTLNSKEGFSSSCCRAHEIWDGLGHCWDGNILPPGWVPPWKGDPTLPQ